MARSYAERLDPNDNATMDLFNEYLVAFTKKFYYDLANLPEFVYSGQAAEFLGCSKMDIRTMAYRKVLSAGPERGTVSLDDVIAKKVIAPFISRV